MPASTEPPIAAHVTAPVSTQISSPQSVHISTQSARFSILRLGAPTGNANIAPGEIHAAQSGVNAGILLEDPARDRLYVRLRRDWGRIAPEEDVEVLEALEEGLRALASELGAAGALSHLEDLLSNLLRVSDRRDTIVQSGGEQDFERALDRLYRQHIPSTVQKYVTHLPRYSLEVAAGQFKENQEVTADGWEEVSGLKLTPHMFVARILGRSMEPKIPDGSLCVFRLGVTGSRQGRLVLVEALARGGNDRYTVKRYRSEKQQVPDGTWSHERVTLEPLNPEFEAWDLNPDDDSVRILAEFVVVLG